MWAFDSAKNLAGAALLATLFLAACAPLRDLDAASHGPRDADTLGGAAGVPSAGGSLGSIGAAAASGAGAPISGAGASSASGTAGAAGSVNGIGGVGGGPTAGFGMGGVNMAGMAGFPTSGPDTGFMPSQAGSAARAGASFGSSGSAGSPSSTGSFAVDLPNDLPGSPVAGDVSYVEASFASGGVSQLTYEVRTPTAIYMLARGSGNLLYLVDRASNNQVQWIGYNDYRPRRIAGVVAVPAPSMLTRVDAESVTARHVRFVCEAATGEWRWVWDFYTTQATLTVTRAALPFGFVYRGTPGGQLDDRDQFVLGTGAAQSAKNSFIGALPGPAGWAYLADPALDRSLFLIQHSPDALIDRYDALDGDSATLEFGAGKVTQTPIRFSLGWIGSSSYAAVAQRAQFVIGAIP